MNNKITRVLITSLVFIFSPVVYATGFKCTYPNHADMFGIHESTGNDLLVFNHEPGSSKAQFTFVALTSFSREVMVIPGDGVITFIDVSLAGNVLTAAVITEGEYKGQSVFSKAPQLFTNGQLIPSQYYGSCSIID